MRHLVTLIIIFITNNCFSQHIYIVRAGEKDSGYFRKLYAKKVSSDSNNSTFRLIDTFILKQVSFRRFEVYNDSIRYINLDADTTSVQVSRFTSNPVWRTYRNPFVSDSLIQYKDGIDEFWEDENFSYLIRSRYNVTTKKFQYYDLTRTGKNSGLKQSFPIIKCINCYEQPEVKISTYKLVNGKWVRDDASN